MKNCASKAVAYRSLLGIRFRSVALTTFEFIINNVNNHDPISKNTNWILAFFF
jgi:hypothetical protein